MPKRRRWSLVFGRWPKTRRGASRRGSQRPKTKDQRPKTLSQNKKRISIEILGNFLLGPARLCLAHSLMLLGFLLCFLLHRHWVIPPKLSPKVWGPAAR